MIFEQEYLQALERKKEVYREQDEKLKSATDKHNLEIEAIEAQISDLWDQVTEAEELKKMLSAKLKKIEANKKRTPKEKKDMQYSLSETISRIKNIKEIFIRKKDERLNTEESHLYMYTSKDKKMGGVDGNI